MGITNNCAKFLLYSKKTWEVNFSQIVTLGRQQFFLSEKEKGDFQQKFEDAPLLPDTGDFAEFFFKALGSQTITSLDYSDFEQATFIHNLNESIPQSQHNKYTVVFDGGTLEHVFNFPVAIKNCMDMLKVGGHFISITPANNYCGHGFYQFSPELFFSVFTEAHGFDLKLVAMVADDPSYALPEWYEVKDPKLVGARVVVSNSWPTSLMVLAQKTKETKCIAIKPFQSDYQHIWNVHRAVHLNERLEGESRWIHYYRRITPEFIKKVIRRIVTTSNKRTEVRGLGTVDLRFFKKIEI